MENSQMSKIHYTLERHLQAMCIENPEYIDLYATWELDKKTYENIMISVIYNYPHYSMHDNSHSKNIINSIEMVLGEERIRLLGPTETWMILQCAYIHDFGMVLQNKYIEAIWEDDNFQLYLKSLVMSANKDLKDAARYILQLGKALQDDNFEKKWPIKVRGYVVQIIADYFRGKHAKLTKDYINNPADWNLDLTHNGLIKSRLFRLAAEISFLHGKNFEDIMKLDYVTNGIKSDYIHPRFIAEMIRLGDLLDLDNNRFNTAVIKVFGKLPELSRYHEEKHASVNHVLITPKLIEVSANCEREEVYRETRKWFSMLKEEINNLTVNWVDIVPECFSGYAPKIGKLEILLNGKRDIIEKVDLKFKISQEKAFEIIEGSNIYKDKIVFLREFIQNAIDASKIQFWRDIKSGIYDPWINKNVPKSKLNPFDIKEKRIFENYKIIIEFNEIVLSDGIKKIRVTVKDSGIGMSYDDLLNISKVGESWDKRPLWKKEIENMPSWLKPTGGFGIGIQSAFLVADEITVQSKTENEIGKIIKFISSKENGYISIVESEDINDRGTSISVDIDENIDFYYSINGYTYKKIRSYDSFEYQGSPVIWKLIEYISEECSNSLFPIISKSNSDEYSYGGIIENYSRLFDEVYNKESQYIYKFSDDYKSILIWEEKTSSLVKLTVLGGNKKFISDCSIQLFFKGIKVGKERILARRLCYELCDIYWDILGMSTKETLSLNRNELLPQAEKKLKEVLSEIIVFALTKYKELILKHPEYIPQYNLNAFEIFMLNEIMFNNNDGDTELKKILIKNSQYVNILVAKRNVTTNKYEYNVMSGSEVLKFYPQMAYIDARNIFMLGYHELDKIEKIIDVLNTDNEINEEYIVIDVEFSHILARLPIVKIQKVKTDIVKNLYVKYCDKNKAYSGIDANEYTIKHLLMFLGIEKVKRTAIPALKKYNILTVDKLRFELYARYYDLDFEVFQKNYIISPITDTDVAKIRSKVSKELLISEIKNRKDFANLIEYVYENQVAKSKYSKDEITQEYIRLIGDYFDIVSETTL